MISMAPEGAKASTASQPDTSSQVPNAANRRKSKATTTLKISASTMSKLPDETLEDALTVFSATQFNDVVKASIERPLLPDVVEEISGVAVTSKPPGGDKNTLLKNLDLEKSRRLVQGEIPHSLQLSIPAEGSQNRVDYKGHRTIIEGTLFHH